MLLASFGVWDVFLSLIYFFLFLIWIMLLFRVFADLFRSDMSGVAKVVWLLFLIVLPYLGVFAYLISRGDRMVNREITDAQAREVAFQDYLRESVGNAPSAAQELERLADLRDRGVIDEAEFAQLKAKVLA